jgi:iron(III) transport system ATP-binding protein
MTLLSLRSVGRRYGPVAALDAIDLDVTAGSRTAILGPSGCGKTTLLRLVAGFDAPTSGEIRLDGEVVATPDASTPAHRRGIGYVAQDGALFPHLSVGDNIGFGIDKADAGRAKRIAELASIVGLDAAALSRRPHQLSGGQQQRVALARAMARKPRLMLLDEPFSALDAGLRASMRRAVAELLEQERITAVLVTHDQAEALTFADQVAVMRDGRFSQVGSPRDLYLKPRDLMVAQFLGEAIVMPARVGGGYADCAAGRIPVEGGAQRESARILLRPEQIELAHLNPGEPLPPPRPGVLYGQVTGTEFGGSVCTVAVRLLNDPAVPGMAAIGVTPLLLRRSAFDAPETGTIVRISVSGKAHVLS